MENKEFEKRIDMMVEKQKEQKQVLDQLDNEINQIIKNIEEKKLVTKIEADASRMLKQIQSKPLQERNVEIEKLIQKIANWD
jgi:hypothetical protein